HEGGQQRKPDSDWDEDAGGGPAERVGADDAVYDRDEAGGDEQRTTKIEIPMPQLGAPLRHEPVPDGDHRRAHGNVDEEDPLPAQALGQHAAQESTRGAADPADRTPEGKRAVAL